MSATTAQVGNLRITTQVVHAADGAALHVPQPNRVLTPITSKYFKKIPVKALSTVLMLIGILQLLLGIVYYASDRNLASLTYRSGVYIWGGIVVFIAGGASLTANLRDTINSIKLCMSCNIVNIVVAAVGLILLGIQTYYETNACWLPLDSTETPQCPISLDTDNHYSYRYSYSYYNSNMIVQLRVSLSIVMFLFSLLGLVISCFMSGLSDKELKISGYSLLQR